MSQIHVQLVAESPFYDIFPGGRVPIRKTHLPLGMPVTVELIGSDEKDAYLLDWKACSDRQRELVVDRLARLQDGTCDEIWAHMEGGGDLPIRVSQTVCVTVVADLRAFI